MENFKKGDLVKQKLDCCGAMEGEIYELQLGYEDGTSREQLIAWKGGKLLGTAKGCSCKNLWTLIKSKNKNMNIKEKFILGLTPEPKKSFRKAEITDGDDILTTEGMQVFLTWLLHTKHADEFKSEVVDDILQEQKESKD